LSHASTDRNVAQAHRVRNGHLGIPRRSFQGQLPMKGTVVAWYAIDRADWQTELAAT
jgi:hypothetical protein